MNCWRCDTTLGTADTSATGLCLRCAAVALDESPFPAAVALDEGRRPAAVLVRPTISLRAASRLLGVRASRARIAGLGLIPVSVRCSSRLCAAYNRAEVLSVALARSFQAKPAKPASVDRELARRVDHLRCEVRRLQADILARDIAGEA